MLLKPYTTLTLSHYKYSNTVPFQKNKVKGCPPLSSPSSNFKIKNHYLINLTEKPKHHHKLILITICKNISKFIFSIIPKSKPEEASCI